MKKKLFVILAIVVAAAIAGVAFAQTSGGTAEKRWCKALGLRREGFSLPLLRGQR